MRLEKIQWDFLWGGVSLDRKIHLVNWDTGCLSKGNGGLGIRSLSIFNRALLGNGYGDFSWRIIPHGEL